MLTGIHFLLTYSCNFECDHCFLYCSPKAEGTFTCGQVRAVLDEAAKIDSMESVFIEGGESFLYYPLVLETIRIAREKGFRTGIVSNCYWATSVEDAELWLRPLRDCGIGDVQLSDDPFHYDQKHESPGKLAGKAAKRLGMSAQTICIEGPTVEDEEGSEKGEPVVGGNARFRGRAVEKLTEGLPRKPWKEFTSCPYEELERPKRVHVDAFGNAHACQGLSIGNIWETPLSELDRDYDHRKHPICRPLISGGPARLATEFDIEPEDGYVDECHFCYLIRLALLDTFPQYLAPRQVYGLEGA